MSIISDKGESILTKELSVLVSKHLGFSDDDLVLSKFIINLYEQYKTESTLQHRKDGFTTALKDNGGEEFPTEFVNSSFSILERYYHNNQKEQNNVKETTENLTGLIIPNRPVRLETDSNQINTKKYQEEKKYKFEDNRNPVIELNQVYKGYVSNIVTYGAFIRLNSPKSFDSGLCHISHISYDGKPTRDVSDVLKFNQEVFVKVIQIEEQQNSKRVKYTRKKITLSMRGIDQVTGIDNSFEIDALMTEERGRKSAPKPAKRRLTSPERWEIRQLIASGAASAEDYPELSGADNIEVEQPGKSLNEDNDVEIDIELNNDEPSFLKGQLHNLAEYSPLRIMKNPEGSLGRTAMTGSKLSKEFKEERMKEQKEKERLEKLERSKSKDHLDPMMDKGANKHDKRVNDVIDEWKKTQMKNVSYGKKVKAPIKEQRESLPVYAMRDELIKSIRENQFIVIVGETGSGKTTQIVQYIFEEGLNVNEKNEEKMIACTQPRRVAAISVAKRVAEEVNCKLGKEVGYNVRFDDVSGPETRIKYMTDGMLQREALRDPLMSKYSVIMLDEAHERTIATDVLFGLLRTAANMNPELKIIVTSATLDSDKFSKYFNDCPIIKIPGRTYPVEILYTKEPEMDYLAAALDSVMQIHLSEPDGDILVFLTGQEEIDTSCEILFQRAKALGESAPELIILPVYSSLPSEMQSRIFEPTPAGSRKVILATNIAETSITIDGIYYVVDPGFVKINAYDPKLGMDSLVVSPISQAQANQRSGRAGRTGPGKCYRLYTESAYNNEMLPNSIPDIQRQNLSNTILLLKAMGINDLLNFGFMDPPPTNTMLSALHDLYTLGALDEEGYLTLLGKKMVEFPMDPSLAKVLINSFEHSCSEEILTIIAMLSIPTIFYRPKEKQNLADQRKARFHHSSGDHLTLLNVYRAWVLNGYSAQWCQENFIQERGLRRAQEVKKQISKIITRFNHSLVSCHNELDRVRKVICSGFFKNSAKRDPQEGYKTLIDLTPVSMHPSSSLFGKSPEYVVYHTLLLTTKEYMNCVTTIDPKWLPEVAPSFFKVSDPGKMNENKKKQKIVPLYDKFAKDKDAWRLSSQNALKKRTLGGS